MIKFLKYIALIVLIIVSTLYMFDYVYTIVYQQSKPRNKTQYVLKLNEKDTINYVFLGSSRVENTVVTSQIEASSGKKSLNLGTPGAKLSDSYLYLKLLIDNKVKIERLFIQVDYTYNFEGNSKMVISNALPFINNSTVINAYLKAKDSNYIKNKYIPFYRYATNDYKLGFRELLASMAGKLPVTKLDDGFNPLYGVMNKNNKSSLPKKIVSSNRNFKSIDSLCKKNAINVTYFCAPFCTNLKNANYVDSLKMRIDGFKDFSKSIKDDALFQNCSHLNDKGAKAFTKLLIDELNL